MKLSDGNRRNTLCGGLRNAGGIKELTVDEKLRMYNTRSGCEQNWAEPYPREAGSKRSLPLIKVPPHMSPKGMLRHKAVVQTRCLQPRVCNFNGPKRSPLGFRRASSSAGVTGKMTGAATLTNMRKPASENIDDDDCERVVPQIRPTQLSGRIGILNGIKIPDSGARRNGGVASPIPTMRYNSIVDVKCRAKSVCESRKVHNLPLYSTGVRTMQGLAARRRPLRSSRSVNGKEMMQMELPPRKEGYLWKLSSKIPEKWQPRYCVLLPQAFVFLRRRGDLAVKGCLQFNLVTCRVQAASDPDAVSHFE